MMNKEDIEKYTKLLENKDNCLLYGIEDNGDGTYTIKHDRFMVITGKMGVLRFIKAFDDELKKSFEDFVVTGESLIKMNQVLAEAIEALENEDFDATQHNIQDNIDNGTYFSND